MNVLIKTNEEEEIRTTAQRILIADNDKVAALMLYVYLFNRGYELEFAADVLDVVAKIVSRATEVVIIDAEFYGHKTYDLLSVIKNIDANVKIILTSKNGSAEEIAQAREAGIFFHAMKPFNFDELNMAINQAVK